jgi:SnoaL-like domain
MSDELAALRARADVQDRLARLALAQDDHDWAVLADCFEPDAVYDHPGGRIEGAEAIVGRSRNALSPLDASQHLVGTTLVTVSGDADATSVSYFQAQHVRHGLPGGDLLIIAGTYRDRLTCRDGVWRVAHRVQEYSWRQGNSEVTRRAPPADAGGGS